MSHSVRMLVFANGALDPGPMVSRALEEAGPDALAIAADGGAQHLLALGLKPHAIVGDMDSVPEDLLVQCRAAGADILRYPAAKDQSDLELALLYAAGQGAGWIRVIAAVGDRLDQTLANILLLTLPALGGRDVCLVAGRQAARILQKGTHILHGAPGDTLSLIPLAGDARGVTAENLAYPLQAEPLLFGPARGISNVFTAAQARVTLSDGLLLAVHTLGRA